mmetsp:Transcript_4422/g.3207  ORF Transcript_4422/g.3207 Transcript_4422/m.3207 type:complete len:147 (+) Transcript_4422:628-1068(+)
MTSMPFFKKKGYASDTNGKKNVIKETLYEGQHELGNGVYNIHIFFSINNDLIIASQHLERNDSYVIEIKQDRVDDLISEFDSDFGRMAEHLKIMNKRMVLLNPKFASKVPRTASPDKDRGKEEVQEDKSRSYSNIERPIEQIARSN